MRNFLTIRRPLPAARKRVPGSPKRKGAGGEAVLVLLFLAALVRLPSCHAQTPPDDPVRLVNPLVGTSIYGGALAPAACLPYSMVKLAPDTTKPSTAGYNPDEPIFGFSHTHIGGTGGNAFAGQILVRPQTGPLDVSLPPSPKEAEFASPGYYTVRLVRDTVTAELTATERSGIHRYTFAKAEPGRVLIDISATLNNVSVESPSSVCTGSEARFVSDREIEGRASFVGGYNRLTYTVYFSAAFNRAPVKRGAWLNATPQPDATEAKGGKGEKAGLYAEFAPEADNRVGLRVGLSYSSVDNARRNRAASDGMTFEQVKTRAEEKWRTHLNTIQIAGGTDKERRQFYTALYDFALSPVELTGDNDLWSKTEPSYWDIYCLWDTFRCASPLLTLIHQDKQEGVLRNLLEVYKQKGWLPDAWDYNQYAFSVQGGTNADILFADAVSKNLNGFDRNLAYQAVKKDATLPTTSKVFSPYGRFAPYFTLGYIPAVIEGGGKTLDGRENEYAHAVSGTLEYAYNDFAVAAVADAVGKKSDAEKYRKRSENVFTLFNPDTKFFWGKTESGAWVPGQITLTVFSGWMPIFQEGNAWQYRFSVPHDIGGLINRLGGNKAFVSVLDEYFDKKYHDAGNEPGFLTPWLYDYAGRPDKTADRVHALLQNAYHLSPNGYAGDEDVGAMSSWYVFGAMGFYPNAGQDVYLLGSPLFSKVSLHLAGGKTFTITANKLSDQNRYVQSAKLNGKPWNKAWFRHGDIVKGATLTLEMGPNAGGMGYAKPAAEFERTGAGRKVDPMSVVQIIRPQDGLSRETGAAIYALANAIWPPEPGAVVPTRDETLATWQAQQSAHFIVTNDDEAVLAHSLIFPRTLTTTRGPLLVGALATVCVHPDYRGRGWGVEVVRAAFDYLGELGAEVSLFQTGVPAFYEKLGGRLVTNQFVNGNNPTNPFWDTCEMIYPAAFDWPGGQIDLNGAGY